MIFMTFHGAERFRNADAHHEAQGPAHPHESPAVVTVPLIALAIPSVLIGFVTAGPILFGNYFGKAIHVLERNDVVGELGREFHGPVQFALHGFATPTFALALAGVLTAWAFFLWRPALAERAARTFGGVRELLVNKYYFDWFNEKAIAPAVRFLGRGLWRGGDQLLIDGAMVNGTAATVSWFGSVVRHVQSGFLYSYAFWMIIGLAMLLGWFLLRI
jgi:NADH-quinone oxidoreductase subunit L